MAGEAGGADLRVAFHRSKVTSDVELLAFRELDDALGLTELDGQILTDTRTGRNGRHTMVAQFWQSVFWRLAGYEDVNDTDQFGRDPAMRCKITSVPAHGACRDGKRLFSLGRRCIATSRNRGCVQAFAYGGRLCRPSDKCRSSQTASGKPGTVQPSDSSDWKSLLTHRHFCLPNRVYQRTCHDCELYWTTKEDR